MLALSKKTDYALIALAYLAERPDHVASAREIADERHVPPALLMNILKELHHHGVLHSRRGVNGGYELAIDPADYSLHDLIVALEGPVRLVQCADDQSPCEHDDAEQTEACRVRGKCSVQEPLQRLHHRLIDFLRDVKLCDVLQAPPRVGM